MSSAASPMVLAPWQIAFLAAAAIGLVIAMSAGFIEPIGRRRTRHWTGFGIAAGFGGLAFLTRGVVEAATVVFLVLLGAAGMAYRHGPSIKLGNRVFSLFPENADGSRPAPREGYYQGLMSPRKYWWILAGMVSFFSFLIVDSGWDWRATAAVAMTSATTAATGVLDARECQRPVRGQYIPAFVALIASIVVYGIPAVAYLLGYSFGHPQSSDPETIAEESQ